jgi:hypothetical protein
VIVRGFTVWGRARALRKNRFAAAASRLAEARSQSFGRFYRPPDETAGEAGVANLLNLFAKEMRVAMTLTGARSVSDITRSSLVQARLA